LKGQRPVSGKAFTGAVAASWIILQSILWVPSTGAKQRALMLYGELLEKIEAGKVAKVKLDQQTAKFN